ncbi:MAG: DUF6279 family lipoprotein [Limnobacter sp.]|uniref:DUF6279 family lipoprotein n=1 Tax=Limnobacter sp. TaxID=2003368 RepID=UPI0032ECAFB2
MNFRSPSTTWFALGAILLLGACSAVKLGYNNSAGIAHTYLINKVSFDEDQSALLKASLNDMVQWHRDNELPRLATELEAAQRVLAPQNGTVIRVSAVQVQALNQSVQASLRRTANQAAPLIAKNMLGLWPNQIQDIQDALNRANDEYREERLMQNPQARQKKSAERMTERFERWLGDLNPTQKDLIARWSRLDTGRSEDRYQKRLERQKQFMILANKAANRQIDQATLSREMSVLLNAWQTPGSATEKADSEYRQKTAIDLVVDVLNVANVEQRSNAAERAAGWAKDFQILASNS